MNRPKPALPMGRVASAAHIERIRQQNEARRAKVERREIEEAMKRQALARDPEHAGIDLDEIDRRSDPTIVIDFHPNTGKIKRAMRTSDNVFDNLRATMEPHEVDAGHRLVEIYAERMGLAGAVDSDDPGFHDRGRPDVEMLTHRMDKASKLWRVIMTPPDGFGKWSLYPLIFADICADIVDGERSNTSAHRSQWRKIVKRFTGVTDAGRQASVIRTGCGELYHILKHVDTSRKW